MLRDPPAMLRKVDRYELLEEIGHGGMATVYRARDTNLDRLVALKLMHPHLRGAAQARARFRREAQSVARLRHPRILEIYDFAGEDSAESYIAAELLTGPTLKQYIEQHDALPAEIAACFGIEIARALEAAHEKGIVHRDVKPENILLHENRCLKLTDFGIADMVDSQSMTATGQILGSPGHMAPEQIEGQPTDARTDVFALGTVLYFLATARLPFTGKNPHQVLKRVLDGDAPDPLRVRPALGASFRALVLRAMAKRPEDRFQSATELAAALRTFVATIGIDDAERELELFLADSAARARELESRVVARYTELGRTAHREGRALDASHAFDRVLAIDENNAEVLGIVQGLARRRANLQKLRAASIATAAIASLMAAAWGLAALVAAPASSPDSAHDADRVDASSALDAAFAIDAAESDASGESALLDAGDELDGRLLHLPIAPVDWLRPRHPVALDAPRRVVFHPDPQNVQIAVDDQPLRAYGPSYESVELSPGPHRFRFVSNVDCCADSTVEREIPSGTTPYTFEHILPSRPAILIVRTNVPADVVVGDGVARGRARSTIDVPLSARTRSESRSITVTAPGHRAYTGDVQLSAGTVTTAQVTLEPLDPSSEAPSPGGG